MQSVSAAATTHAARVCSLYKHIFRLHRGLPTELRAIGDVYVRDEFKRHKTVTDDEANVFLRTWAAYVVDLSKQLSHKGISKGTIGADLNPELLDNFSDEQLYQLYDLKTEANKPKS